MPSPPQACRSRSRVDRPLCAAAGQGARLGDTSDLRLQGLEVVNDGNGAEPRPLICPARRSVSRVAPSPHRRERVPRLNDAQQRELGEG